MKNINVKQYLELKNKFQYDLLLTALQPINIFEKNINDFSYLDVINLFNFAKVQDDYSLFELFYNLKKYEFEFLNVVDYFASKKFIINFLKVTAERQSKLLNSISVDNEKWKLVERGRLNKFSDIMPLVQLAEIYKVYPFDLQNKPYSEIFSLLVLHKTRRDIENDFNRLK